MKSPLVEALRQARDSKSSTEQAEPMAENRVAPEPVEAEITQQAPDADDRQLLDSSGGPASEAAGILPIDGPGILPIDGPGILPIDGPGILTIDYPGSSAAGESDTELYEATGLQVANDQSTSPIAADDQSADAAPYPPVSRSDRRMGMPRLGIYSPLICLVLATVAAGIYFTYQNASGRYKNSELASLLSQIGAPGNEDGLEKAESDRPTNRFELVVGPQIVTPDNARIESARMESAHETLLSNEENLGR